MKKSKDASETERVDLEQWPDDYYKYGLTEDGKKLAKVVRELERVWGKRWW